MKIFKRSILIFSTLLVILFFSFFSYCFLITKDLNQPTIQKIIDKPSSVIYDSSNNLVESLNQEKTKNIQYNKLPKLLINGLLSIEDNEFFYHNGINYSRIIQSLVNNIFSSTKQGGSTITQQLVKNLILSNEQSLKRKIQEAYLAILLEQNLSKEEILEFYFNNIYFEPSVPGIYYASKRYFDKEVDSLSLVEIATLVGLVKSPSYYNPFTHTDRANNRKNIVLKSMYQNKYITYVQYQNGINKHLNTFLIDKGSTFKNKTYNYQAYLDVVYQEVEELTSLNPFSFPLKIETYLDTSIQSYYDDIQEGKVFTFNDDYQQIASVVIDNSSGGIISIIGGRNYQGMMLFNRCKNMLRQPASTFKPVFTYSLAIEYLKYHEYSLVEDQPYTYKNTNVVVHNADKKYLGFIPLVEAIGYSRNTSTLFTLEKVINKIGIDRCVSYLSSLNLMDQGEFVLPYALGGMKYGISPLNLAGSYAMLARNGNYLKPTTIKRITRLDTNEVIYTSPKEGKQILEKETCYIMTSTLKKVMDNNYYNIQYAKPRDIIVCAKTGTNAYDQNTINKKNYPSYADKDVWFAGYSKKYSLALWTGFDEVLESKKTYFGKNDSRRLIVKDIFRTTLERLELKNNKFKMPETLTTVNIVKGIKKDYLPNSLIPQSLIVQATFKKEDEPNEILPFPKLNNIENPSIFLIDTNIEINILSPLEDDELYLYIFGKKIYFVIYEDINHLETYIFLTNNFIIPCYEEEFSITISESFENNTSIHGEEFIFTYPILNN